MNTVQYSMICRERSADIEKTNDVRNVSVIEICPKIKSVNYNWRSELKAITNVFDWITRTWPHYSRDSIGGPLISKAIRSKLRVGSLVSRQEPQQRRRNVLWPNWASMHPIDSKQSSFVGAKPSFTLLPRTNGTWLATAATAIVIDR